MLLNLLERHRDKWVEDGDCYRWTAALGSSGHGAGYRVNRPIVGIRGEDGKYKTKQVARLMCEEAHGPPPTPKHQAAHNVLDGCIGSLCVNGEHLRWATAHENQMDVSPEERSDRIRRGAINIPIEVKRERSRRSNLARWGRKEVEDAGD